MFLLGSVGLSQLSECISVNVKLLVSVCTHIFSPTWCQLLVGVACEYLEMQTATKYNVDVWGVITVVLVPTTAALLLAYLLLVALACKHDELHGVRDVRVSLCDAWRSTPSLLQLTLQLQRNGHIQLVHLHCLATALLQGRIHKGQLLTSIQCLRWENGMWWLAH